METLDVKAERDSLTYQVEYPPSGNIHDYKIARHFGQIPPLRSDISFLADIREILGRMQYGDKLVLNFRGIKLTGFIDIEESVMHFAEVLRQERKGKYVILKDVDIEPRAIIALVLQQNKECSPLLYYSDENKYTILNLPQYLQRIIKAVQSDGMVTGNELADILNTSTHSARVSLNLLFRRGLVEREAIEGLKGKPVFRYRLVSI